VTPLLRFHLTPLHALRYSTVDEPIPTAFSQRARAGSLRHAADPSPCAQVLEKEPFTVSMLEKLMWIAAFMLVGARHAGSTVGDVESQHTAEVRALIEELMAGLTATQARSAPRRSGGRAESASRITRELCACARAVDSSRGGVKRDVTANPKSKRLPFEFPWDRGSLRDPSLGP
jgi:hypothetical protein